MEIEIGRGKKARRAYGFDDIAIVPSRRTRDAEDVDIAWRLGPHLLELPLSSPAFLHDVERASPFVRNPLYAVIHEACSEQRKVTSAATSCERP